MKQNIFTAAYDILMLSDPRVKCASMHELYKQWTDNAFTLESKSEVVAIPDPGRPEKPVLISPRELPKRSLHTEDGRLVFMHAIAHIEFNAINLALDAVYRFRDQPKSFYEDWLKVADDEARHFILILDYLESHGATYGDHDAHNGLWETVEQTDHDIMHRMALVPRVLEARGLDVTPMMLQKLRSIKAGQEAEILEVIYHDEISHVEAGSKWFRYHCELRKLDSKDTFIGLIHQYMKGRLKGPFNLEARLLAGFEEEEVERLKQLN